MVLKGEIPWSPELRVEAKNFRIFLVHTVSLHDRYSMCVKLMVILNVKDSLAKGVVYCQQPNRTYYLEDPESYALEWERVIDEVRIGTYGRDTT